MTKRTTIILVAVIAVFAGILFSQTQTQQQREPVAQAQHGRYQIVINPSIRADTFLLDTATGKIWKPIQYTNLKGEPDVWVFQPRVGNERQPQDWSATQEIKEK